MADPNPLDDVKNLQNLVVGYARQETIEPLKALGRYLGFGMAGSILVFFGVVFLGFGALRFLQTLDWFAGGSWASTVPYLLTLVILAGAATVILLASTRATRKVK
ncbi:MAG: phage holin family protein [Acidimicrobiales bacterium]